MENSEKTLEFKLERTIPAPLTLGKRPVQACRGSGGSKVSQATERQAIIRALEDTKGQVGGPDGAAARLGMKRTTLQSRMRKLNIARQYR